MNNLPPGQRRETLLLGPLVETLQQIGGSGTISDILERVKVPTILQEHWRYEPNKLLLLRRGLSDAASYLKVGAYLTRSNGVWTLPSEGMKLNPPFSEPKIHEIMAPGNRHWYPNRLSP